MSRETVRDRAGRVLGWYESNGISGRIDARDSAGRWLGYYDKKLNELAMQQVVSLQREMSFRA